MDGARKGSSLFSDCLCWNKQAPGVISSEPGSVVGPSGHVTGVRTCSKIGVHTCSKARVHSCPQTFVSSCLRAGAVTVTSLPPPQGPLKSLRLRIWLL